MVVGGGFAGLNFAENLYNRAVAYTTRDQALRMIFRTPIKNENNE